MRYREDKQGSKFLFLAILIIVLYLAFFNFNIRRAYVFTVENVRETLQELMRAVHGGDSL